MSFLVLGSLWLGVFVMADYPAPCPNGRVLPCEHSELTRLYVERRQISNVLVVLWSVVGLVAAAVVIGAGIALVVAG